MLDEPVVLLDRQDVVAGGHEIVGAVRHQDRQPGTRAVALERHRHHGVVDDGRGTVVEAGLPHPVLPVRGVAGARA